MILKNFLYILLFLIPVQGVSQLTPEEGHQVDSLKAIIESDIHDSLRVSAIKDWDDIIYLNDPDLDLELNENIIDLCSKNLNNIQSPKEEIFFLDAKAYSLNNIGLIYWERGAYDEAAEKFKKSLGIHEKLGFDDRIVTALGNIGLVYSDKGDYKTALDYHSRSLEIKERIGDNLSAAVTYGNIGSIYQSQGNYAAAIEYQTKCLTLNEAEDEKLGAAIALNYIGSIYQDQGDYSEALKQYQRALNLNLEIDAKRGIASSYNNIGNVYAIQEQFDKGLDLLSKSLQLSYELGNVEAISSCLNNIGAIYEDKAILDSALVYYDKSLQLRKSIGNRVGIAISNNSLGSVYFKLGDMENAQKHSSEALDISISVGAKIEQRTASMLLWSAYKKKGQFKLALDMYDIYIKTRDSIASEANQKSVIRQEYKYQYEKQAATDSITNAEAQKVKDALLSTEKAENKQHQLEAKQQKQKAYFLYGGLGLALLFGGFIFNRFRVTSKQKGIIEEQKEKVDEAFDELEEKNQEILDSINYAKRIQNAILPPAKVVKEYLQESFILYKPKDIVAGDFYWLEHRDGKVLFAAADCTGHGVPGAMVSVVCNNGLNRSVREYGLTEPGKILDKTREIVIQEFEKSEDEVKDGMDIALCSLEGNKLQYAGAHNPLWIIRKGEVLETKANKQPIGKFDKQTAYTTHTFELEKGDSIYIFSDGYVDQFGGVKGKKFKSKAFRELLLSIQDKTMEEQRILIDEAFETWRGSLEQIDDVCVIGVRV